MHYSLLDSDIKIKDAVEHFISLERIAVDFEGEFNLHIYGDQLCLIHIFEGKDFFIIDPRSNEVSEKGLSRRDYHYSLVHLLRKSGLILSQMLLLSIRNME